jgi:Helicase C-terminal domain
MNEIPANFAELFALHRSGAVPRLWDWQLEVLKQYEALEGDAAVELPTGAGKTLIGLLTGEQFRLSGNDSVAYLAGNKQLAQQVDREGRELGFPLVRFEGPKEAWSPSDVRAVNYGEAIGVMNYWNYFNAKPGIDPVGMLIMDDVHLLEGPLRDMFTVSVRTGEDLAQEILSRIVACYPYYSYAEDLLNGLDPLRPPEMLVFPDSADLADEIRSLLDTGLDNGSPRWWAWQQIRDQLQICCWLISARAVTFAPYIPPTQTLEHFRRPQRRLYLSATVGTVDDMQRRLGAPDLEKLTATVQPRQGKRLVIVRNETDELDSSELIAKVRPLLEQEKKALWLCARKETASNLCFALTMADLDGEIRVLEGNNGADEPFSEDDEGHLIAAGRYDGMDFPDEACRVEVVPEIPVATSDLEEFVSAYMRDAPFARARFAQRVAQALGRCNRSEDDRATYLLTDPEFVSRFSSRSVLDTLPSHVREDIYSALQRADHGFEGSVADAQRFLRGEEFEPGNPPARQEQSSPPETARDEIEGFLALWSEDFNGAAERFDLVASKLGGNREYRAFWLAMRALSLKLAAGFGDEAAGRQAKQALEAAAASGGRSAFFTRLRLSGIRLSGSGEVLKADSYDDLFTAWDRLVKRYGANGPRFERWSNQLRHDLGSDNHDLIARRIADVGQHLLGLAAGAPKPVQGEEDAYWELAEPRRTLTFEVKMAPENEAVFNKDVQQAESAAVAAERGRENDARGILISPHPEIEETAAARLERVRLMTLDDFAAQVESLLRLLQNYRRGWTDDAAVRAERRASVADQLPVIDWLWRASLEAESWMETELLEEAWAGG